MGTLGYEWDVDADDGFRPAGLIDMSSTTYSAPEVFTDYGSTVAPGTATHSLTMYKAPSGALVFGAGTVQWAWGLDNYTTGKATDKNMQQATVNLFADMGVQPATLLSGLTVASPSADVTAPTSVITSPVAGASIADGTATTVSGTASDAGGGVVAGVEVSTDNGTTWHPASGTTNWTYSWVAHGNPGTTIKVRATDDSGNVQNTPGTRSLTVACPCSVFGSTIPALPDSGDGSPVQLGMKFKSDVNGTIQGIRFYKSSANTGTHVGSLWSSTGTLLASATFTSETATGWQNVSFSTPVNISAGTVYIAGYYAPKGHYAQSSGHMYNNPSPMPLGNASLDSGPLHALRNTPSSPNGLYLYASGSTFPTNTYNAENYWVDVNFTPTGSPSAPAVTSTAPSAGATGSTVGTTPTATFNQPVTGASVVFTLNGPNGSSVPGSASYNAASNSSTFTPSTTLAYGTTYTATVSGATNAGGQAMAAPYSWSFTTSPAPSAPTVSSTSPAGGASGVAVTSSATATFDQAITGSSATFTLRDTNNATVAGVSGYNAGSNTMTFTPSASLAYGTTYTATVSGATNATGQIMAAPYSWSFSTAAAPAPPAVASTAPASGATGVDSGTAPAATFNQSVTGSSVAFSLKDANNATVAGNTTYTAATNTASFTPGSKLAYSTTYTATVSGATNSSGQTMAVPLHLDLHHSRSTGLPLQRLQRHLHTGHHQRQRPQRRRTRHEIPQRRLRATSPASASTREPEHRNPHRLPLVRHRITPGLRHLHRRNRQRLATSQLLHPRQHHRRHHLRRLLLRTQRLLLLQHRLLHHRQRQRPPARPGQRHRRTQRRLPLRQRRLPHRHLQQHQLLGRHRLHRDRPAGPCRGTSTAPASGATGVDLGTAPAATFNQSVTGSSVAFSLKDANNAAVAGNTTYTAATNTASFTPGSKLAYSTTYTATVSGATNSSGQTMASPYTWTFTTAAAPVCPCSVFNATSTPATITTADPNGVELGMKFRSDVPGNVTGVRFYKGAQNTGTHTGYLWSGTGSLLASVTFTAETASGWQQANFSTPVSITAGTTYVVSYYAPNGYYSSNTGYFTTANDNGPLHGLASGTDGPNGVYRYGNAAYPTDTYNNTNYWVDIAFTATSP